MSEPRAGEERQAPPGPDRRSSPLVLIAEDEPDNRLILETVVEALCGAEVVAVTNGMDVVPTAERVRPNLILLDLMLPLMDGFAVARFLKSRGSTAAIPIIAVSALARAGDRDEALRAGCDDFLRKPFELDELEAKVRAFLA